MAAGEVVGLEFPVKNAYWWFPFFGGYGENYSMKTVRLRLTRVEQQHLLSG